MRSGIFMFFWSPVMNFVVAWRSGGADSAGGRSPEWRDLQQRGEDQTLEGRE